MARRRRPPREETLRERLERTHAGREDAEVEILRLLGIALDGGNFFHQMGRQIWDQIKDERENHPIRQDISDMTSTEIRAWRNNPWSRDIKRVDDRDGYKERRGFWKRKREQDRHSRTLNEFARGLERDQIRSSKRGNTMLPKRALKKQFSKRKLKEMLDSRILLDGHRDFFTFQPTNWDIKGKLRRIHRKLKGEDIRIGPEVKAALKRVF